MGLALTFTCLSILVNALFAGGIFTFPIMSTALAVRCNLTQPQLTTIVLAGMIGQYPFSAFVGRIIDRRGPATCSAVASVLISVAFGLFAHEISMSSGIEDPYVFYRLTLYFFSAGLGTVFSYFSTVFAASRVLPNHSGIAAGTSMSLFGLSPLFLSTVASRYFTTEYGLDIISFLKFLAFGGFMTHIIGSLTLRMPLPKQEPGAMPPPTPQPLPPSSPRDTDCNQDPAGDSDASPDERTALLRPSPTSDTLPVVAPQNDSLLSLLKDSHFWVLAILLFLSLGMCEMVISNIGSIVLSLAPFHEEMTDSSPGLEASSQVKFLSLANTLSRIAVGPLADFVSPVSAFLPPDAQTQPQRHYISRMSFLAASSLLLATTFLVVNLTVRSQSQLWILSIGSGVSYGAIFTVLPSIVSSIWGMPNLGRNFGAITYAPFLGTPVFSYLYAFVSAQEAEQSSGVCYGTICWRFTFWVCFAAAILSFIGSVVLWRRWKGRL